MNSDHATATQRPARQPAARARSATPIVRSRPVVDHTDAVAVARDWLSGAGLVPTEQQVAELVPMARHWEPLARRVAISLVAAGQRPARQRVETFTRARITGRRQQTHATRAAIADFGARADQVAGWVARRALAPPRPRPHLDRTRPRPRPPSPQPGHGRDPRPGPRRMAHHRHRTPLPAPRATPYRPSRHRSSRHRPRLMSGRLSGGYEVDVALGGLTAGRARMRARTCASRSSPGGSRRVSATC